MGGAGMILAMVESSSGAASASAMKLAITSGVAGRISIPAKTSLHNFYIINISGNGFLKIELELVF